ncbi:MAG TPA: gamma-glutamylcyclotransferase [Magnetospirillum sp.]|nr:gamma-glutamylcyclotransferase [Magnetospirillum sp.]
MTASLRDEADLSSKPCGQRAQPGEGTWVFAYGSLIWRPDFQPAETRMARLAGWHRAMCILSTVYRGTPERPGLVLGLDRGGSCLGRALRVAPAQWPEVKAMLDARELVTGVYHARFVPVRLDDGRRVPAYAFVCDRSHRQYWSGGDDEAVRLIRQGRGGSGWARDYLASTVEHLAALGIGDRQLQRLLSRVDGESE